MFYGVLQLVLEVRDSDVNLGEELEDVKLVLEGSVATFVLVDGALATALGLALATLASDLGRGVEVVDAVLLADESSAGLVLEGVDVLELRLLLGDFDFGLLWQQAAAVIEQTVAEVWIY